MINVWCVCVGDKYNVDQVTNLYRMVYKNLTIPFSFNVLRESKYTGWWAKLDMLSQATGPCVYLDLDTIILGNIDYLVDYTFHKIAAPANWGQSGHGGIQSSVMAWSGNLQEIKDKFDYEVDSKRLHGDQCFLTELYEHKYVKLPMVYSYKYHARNTSLPPDAKIICFHGKPDYWEVQEPWIKKALS